MRIDKLIQYLDTHHSSSHNARFAVYMLYELNPLYTVKLKPVGAQLRQIEKSYRRIPDLRVFLKGLNHEIKHP